MTEGDVQGGAVPPRPRAHMAAIRQLYPQVWSQVEDFRRQRGKGLPAWPEWCYLPLAAAYAIVSGGGENKVSLDRSLDIARIGALAAWRVSQGIYAFDAGVLDGLWQTPIDGEIPEEILYRLPEWCVYVETPGRTVRGMGPEAIPIHGYYAHLEWDPNDERRELRLLLDATAEGQDYLLPIILHLGHGTLDAALGAAHAEALRVARAHGEGAVRVAAELAPPAAELAQDTAALVSALLYLCSQAAEITQAGTSIPHPHRVPLRFPKGPTTWDVAVRLGAAIREAHRRGDEAAGGGSHASPRAHIRRAHWHTYLTGPREGEQRRELRWLPPIPVNVDLGDLVPTIHRVH